MIVALTTDRSERLDPGVVLDADGVTLVVEAAQPHQHRWIVTFAGVAGREAAEALRGRLLRAEPLDDPDALWVHDVVGAEVVTTGGRRAGRVVAVHANPAHDLLELDTGRLVPVVFVTDDSGRPDRLVIDPPAGLLDDDL